MKAGKSSLDNYGLGSPFRIPRMPVEWLDGRTWRLPSGKALAEFALQAGFIAPMLMKAAIFGGAPPEPEVRRGAGRRVATRETR